MSPPEETVSTKAEEPSPGRLTILLGARDHAGHHSLMVEVLAQARKAKLAGATAMQGTEGLGRSGVAHHRHGLSGDGPVAIVVIDERAVLEEFVEELGGLLAGAVVVVEDVRAFRA
ncbi:MAG: DUF190 domain-containing protein [Acidimicrobiales bacterium]